MKLITSRDNAFYKQLTKLAASAHRRKLERSTLLDGIHLIDTYFSIFGQPEMLIVSASGCKNAEISGLLSRLEVEGGCVVLLGDSLFREVSPVRTPTGILALVSIPSQTEIRVRMHECFHVLLEAIQDPGNVGSILRSAAAAGATDIHLSEGCADAWSPKTLRAAMGAHFQVRMHEQSDLASVARAFDGRVIATTLKAEKSLYRTRLAGPVAFMFGNEGAGLTDALLEAAEERICIPMPGGMESLNVAAAAAVCFFERVRQSETIRVKVASSD